MPQSDHLCTLSTYVHFLKIVLLRKTQKYDGSIQWNWISEVPGGRITVLINGFKTKQQTKNLAVSLNRFLGFSVGRYERDSWFALGMWIFK